MASRPFAGKLVLIGLLLATFLPAGCASSRRAGVRNELTPNIRVRLAANTAQVQVAGTAPAAFVSTGDGVSRKLEFPPGAAAVPVTYSGAGWLIGNVTLPGGEVTVTPFTDGTLSIEGTAYRGTFRLIPTGPASFDVINTLDIDSYLQGVLGAELFKDWDVEAYKAQAIAARTYALYEAKTQGAGRTWDVWSDVKSQAYKGLRTESEKSIAAVEATRGIVVAYGPKGDEKIFKAYFSACCGGVGQNVTDAFNDTYIPPLSERSVGSLCSISKRFNWEPVTLSKQELTRRIKAWGVGRNHPIQNLQMVDRIEVSYVNRYGRPAKFMVTDVSGQRYTLGSEETRWACNADRKGTDPILFSSFFKPVNQSSEIVFTEGHGFGHGVGLCQWCAQAMALRGVPGEEIVRYSYPQAVLVRAY